MGLSARPAETALTERALERLRQGPAESVPLIEYVCQMPGAPKIVAEQMALALFAGRPEIARDADGKWRIVDVPITDSPLPTRAPNAERRAPSAANAERRAPSAELSTLSYAVVDVETTGMNPATGDRVTEIAAVVVREGRIVDRFETLVNPERSIPSFITALTHISWDMVKDAPRFADVADRFLGVLEGHVFVAHNAEFDWRFVRAEVQRATGRKLAGPRLCTVKMARRLLPHLPSRRLDALMYHYGVDNDARHRAGGDAAATAQILLRLLADARDRECRTWDDLQALLGARARGNRPHRPSAMPRPVREDGAA
ncbi:MAG TPA: 3'-5' exonuclease [Gemmatimonadaceae bacterium]|nr:3'-5' exonuclease [Gemmatimonadaceae bacterium]